MSKDAGASNTKMGNRPGLGRSHGPQQFMTGEKAKDWKKSSRKLLSYLAPYRLRIGFVFVIAALSTVFNIVGPKFLAVATDEVAAGVLRIAGGAANGIDFGKIGEILLVLLGLYLLSSLFIYIQGFIMAGVSTKVSYDLRNAVMAKINRLPLSFFHKVSHGEVLSRITNDVDTLNNSLSQSLTTTIISVVTVVGVLAMMFSISWQLTLVALCILPLTALLVMVVVKVSQKYFKGQQEYLGSVNGHIEEMYGGHLVVKVFNGEAQALEKFEEENNKLYDAAWKAQFFSGMMFPVMNFIGNLGFVAICILGAAIAASGRITIGGIQAFIQYVRSFTHPIAQIANISNLLQQTAAAAERVFEFLEEDEEQVYETRFTMAEAGIQGDVRFEHVKFAYEDTDRLVIKDFSAHINSGQKVAIVGPTGAGKTTLVKLMMRFHDLTEGAIYVDGYNIEDFSRCDLRTKFGMVLQDTWLYNDTIMANIRYGRLEATDEEVIAAAKMAQVDPFIRTLPNGYQTVFNEEATNVSQGQKQLLTIARAILADSRIMILDEATSSVDTRTEILIQKAMDHLLRGRTSFIIAHRLSTVRGADLILCINEGDIVEQGTHEELLQKGGFYAALYNSQFAEAS